MSQSGERALQKTLESNRPEWETLMEHPDYSEKWVLLFLQRTTPIVSQAIMDIYRNPDLRRSYRVRLGLVRCKSTPPSIAMNLISSIRWGDLFNTLRAPHLGGPIRKKIELKLMEVLPRLPLGGKIALARQAPRPMIRHLRLLPERPVIKALLNNYFFTYEDAMFLANFPQIKPGPLEELALSPRWRNYPEVRTALVRNQRTPRAVIAPLIRGISDHQLRLILRDPKTPVFNKGLVRRVLEHRTREKNAASGGKPAAKRNAHSGE